MKIKPYRVCDICGQPYERESGCMHITAKQTERDLGVFWDYKWRVWDLCPNCRMNMYYYLRSHTKDKEDER